MVRGDKRNKREYERRKATEEETKPQRRKDETEKQRGRDKPPGDPVRSAHGPTTELPPSNFKGVREDAAKLITEANQRFLEAREEEQTGTEERWRRNITSNWTRYEIQSEDEEDEEEDGLTGADWNFALSSGNRAESHIKLKGEQDWETTGSTGLSGEFFSLDIAALDSAIRCIPLHIQIGINREDLDSETVDIFNKKAEVKEYKLVDELPLLALLRAVPDTSSSKKPDGTKLLSSPVPRTEQLISSATATEQLEFSSPVKSAPQEQRQRRRREKDESDEILEETAKPQLPSQPLHQRVLRKDRKPEPSEEIETEETNPSVSGQVAPVQPSRTAEETDDLEFLESLDRPAPAPESNLPVPGVVPVKIVKDEEKKDLEDWLDDFLGD